MNRNLDKISPYVISDRKYSSDMIYLDWNEGYDIPDEVRKDIQNKLYQFKWNQYPDLTSKVLLDKLSKYTNTDKEFIQVYNGSDSALDHSFRILLNDGDNVEARTVEGETKNTVSIEGAIMIPGKYELGKNLDIRSLVKSAGGLKESALKERAYIIREADGFQQEVVSINLKESMSLKKTYLLKNNDNVIIASVEDLTSEKNVAISGEVNEPGSFTFFEGVTVVDLVLMAKGISDRGTGEAITIYRSTLDSTQKNPVEEISINLPENLSNINSNQNIKLMANDLVVVRSKLGYQPKEYVSVSGLVKAPGDYALKSNLYSVYDLITDFKGFLPDAQLSGVKLRRKAGDIKSVDGEITTVDNFIEIGLNIDKILKSKGLANEFNLTLKDGDNIFVPRKDNSIEINGQVQQATAIAYYRGLTTASAINKSGGFSSNAKKSAVYVVYQNGSVASTKSFLFFRNYPKILPGCKIVVPAKPDKTNRTSVGEIVGYTTSLVSIIALIKSL